MAGITPRRHRHHSRRPTRASAILPVVNHARICYNVPCMKRDWKEIKQGDQRAQWAGIYATLNGKGMIVLNRAADERMGSPAAYNLLYDAPNNVIGLKPTAKAARCSTSADA